MRASTEARGMNLENLMDQLKLPTRMVICFSMACSRITFAMVKENILGLTTRAPMRVHTSMVNVKPIMMEVRMAP